MISTGLYFNTNILASASIHSVDGNNKLTSDLDLEPQLSAIKCLLFMRTMCSVFLPCSKFVSCSTFLYVCMYVCMYVCIRKFITREFLQPKQSRVSARRPYWKDVSLACYRMMSMWVGSRSKNGKEFHSFGAQAAKLHGPKVEVRQASTCKSPQAAERKWWRLVLAVTGTHSSWRYSGTVWWRHLKMIKQSLKTILSGTGSQWRSSRSVGIIRSNLRFRIMIRAAECKTDWRVFVAVVSIWYNRL